MKLEEFIANSRRVESLACQFKRVTELINYLLENNGNSDPFFAIPEEVLQHVDTDLAAKGLVSLLIETKKNIEAKLIALGINIE
jgi:hypothetical protein